MGHRSPEGSMLGSAKAMRADPRAAAPPGAPDAPGTPGEQPASIPARGDEPPLQGEADQEPTRVSEAAPDWACDIRVASTGTVGRPEAPESLPQADARAVQLEAMLGRLARRIAWGGDGRKGTARIELDAGELAGAILLVHTEHDEVEVELQLPPGVPADDWHTRLEARLVERGLTVRRFDVS